MKMTVPVRCLAAIAAAVSTVADNWCGKDMPSNRRVELLNTKNAIGITL